MKEAIGMIETKGFVTFIGVLDSMLKAANVELIGYKKKLGAGLVTTTIVGDVGAVNAAIQVGLHTGNKIGEVVTTHVIPRVGKNVTKVFDLTEDAVREITIANQMVKSTSKAVKQEKPVKKEVVDFADEKNSGKKAETVAKKKQQAPAKKKEK